ncbi:MAG: protease modulator HflC [Gammaproteobacteria bacterium]|nr:protease modulator HflC [Gammaproteobacteria bacterium]
MIARLAPLLVAIFVAGYFSIFTVKEQETAILFKLGEIQRADYDPGLHFMVPVLNNVRKFDVRLQTLDAEPQRFLTAEKKDVKVDSFVRWRITNVADFYTATGGNPRRAGILLYQKINDALRNEFGKRTVQEVVSGERGAIMDLVTEQANERGRELGMEIIDVRLKRIDLPDEVASNVYDRMRSERARVARELRAQGDKEALALRADADRQRTVIVSEAYRDAEELRGAGDAGAAEIYASAYEQDREFYDFYRSLTAYKRSFGNDNDILLLSPDSDFFKYLRDPDGGS